ARPAWLNPAAPDSKSHRSDDDPQPPTFLIEHRAKTTSPRILIAGHLDTVHDPTGPFQRLAISADGRSATGPGAADMKGGILVAIHALESLHERGIEFNWTVLLNSDEETGSFASLSALRQAASQHDIGIALEPAMPGGALVVERMGSGQFMIEVFGQSAH